MNPLLVVKVVPWLFAAMTTWIALDWRHPHNTATAYEQIAQDAARVAYDPAEEPLFAGETGRAKSALLLLAIASLETSYDPDVDSGKVRGDSGDSWCLMQVHLPNNSTVRLSGDSFAYGGAGAWTGSDLVADRTRCFRIALRMVRASLRACHDLRMYVAGRCVTDDPTAPEKERKRTASILALASHRLGRATTYYGAHRPDVNDGDIVTPAMMFFIDFDVGELDFQQFLKGAPQ